MCEFSFSVFMLSFVSVPCCLRHFRLPFAFSTDVQRHDSLRQESAVLVQHMLQSLLPLHRHGLAHGCPTPESFRFKSEAGDDTVPSLCVPCWGRAMRALLSVFNAQERRSPSTLLLICRCVLLRFLLWVIASTDQLPQESHRRDAELGDGLQSRIVLHPTHLQVFEKLATTKKTQKELPDSASTEVEWTMPCCVF